MRKSIFEGRNKTLMEYDIAIIDAFANKVFCGNQAAVIVLDQWLSDGMLQSIASENNLSETAFLIKQSRNTYHIRWFSPLKEIAFCGHATLASAFVLFNDFPKERQFWFKAEAVGTLAVTQNNDGSFSMDFPNTCPEKVEHIPSQLQQGLSILPTEVLRNKQAYFVVYTSQNEVFEVKTDNAILRQLAPYDVVVTASAHDQEYDFVSRYFWPANGGEEDPVTGSIHTGLAPFWATRLGKNSLKAYQASKREGVLNCEVVADRVFITGHAVEYLRGKINLPESS